MEQKIDLERLNNIIVVEEVRSVRARKSKERDTKIFQAQNDLVSRRYDCTLIWVLYIFFLVLLISH